MASHSLRHNLLIIFIFNGFLLPRNTEVDGAALELMFTVRASEAFLEFLAGPVVNAVIQGAPRIRLRFAPRPDKDARPLREGFIDLDIGLLGTSAPEIRTQFLFHDKYIGVARAGHPLLAGAGVTPERYAACKHIVASREGMLSSLSMAPWKGLVLDGPSRLLCGPP